MITSVSHDFIKATGELPRRPLNLITIMGSDRTGKSYFMERLARNDVFPVSGKAATFTAGANMSATLRETACLLHGNTQGESHLSSPMVGFVDVERSCETHVERDVLATPLLLISKVRSKQVETVARVREALRFSP